MMLVGVTGWLLLPCLFGLGWVFFGRIKNVLQSDLKSFAWHESVGAISRTSRRNFVGQPIHTDVFGGHITEAVIEREIPLDMDCFPCAFEGVPSGGCITRKGNLVRQWVGSVFDIGDRSLKEHSIHRLVNGRQFRKSHSLCCEFEACVLSSDNSAILEPQKGACVARTQRYVYPSRFGAD